MVRLVNADPQVCVYKIMFTGIFLYGTAVVMNAEMKINYIFCSSAQKFSLNVIISLMS